jgi:pimeloyl-ACP methyl ester carboxylesterase
VWRAADSMTLVTRFGWEIIERCEASISVTCDPARWATQRGASTAAFNTPSKTAAWQTVPSWYFISSNDQIITANSELAMAKRAHSHITVFPGGSHLTLISHPNAVTATIASAIRSVS